MSRLRFRVALFRSRRKLLSALDGARDVTFIRSVGNTGDDLIYAGTRRLLSGLDYKEVGLHEIDSVEGELAILAGGGAWCRPFHELLPAALPRIEDRFERVVIFPSSFDPSVDAVREALLATRARVFSRELESFRLISGLCDAALAYDCAFFFDYRPYRRRGSGVLTVFREDAESLLDRLLEKNNDISRSVPDLSEWLRTIAACREVHTDRAHVMVAAAMLGKRVRYRPSSYHKVPAMAEFSLRGFPVRRFEPIEHQS